MRNAMSDDDFWQHVYGRNDFSDDYEPDYEPDEDIVNDEACPVCSATGSCSWDVYGNPLIHAVKSED